MEDWICFRRIRECEHACSVPTLLFSNAHFSWGQRFKDCEIPSTHTQAIQWILAWLGTLCFGKCTTATPISHIWLVKQTEHAVTWTAWIPLELLFSYSRVWLPQCFLMSSCSDFYLFCQVFGSGYFEKPLRETFLYSQVLCIQCLFVIYWGQETKTVKWLDAAMQWIIQRH